MGFLAMILGPLMRMLYQMIPNFAVTMIVFTVIIKLLMLPLMIKQQKEANKKKEEKIKELQKKSIKTYAAHLRGENAYDEEDYTTGCAFLIGNEGNGLRDEVADCADCLIRIPMEGEAESLNAAVAAAVLMFEAGRQRRKK